MIYFKLNVSKMQHGANWTKQWSLILSAESSQQNLEDTSTVDKERLAVPRTSSSIHKHGLTSTSYKLTKSDRASCLRKYWHDWSNIKYTIRLYSLPFVVYLDLADSDHGIL